MNNENGSCFYNDEINQLIKQNFSLNMSKVAEGLSNYKRLTQNKIIEPRGFCRLIKVGLKKSPDLLKKYDYYSFSILERDNNFYIYYDKNLDEDMVKYIVMLQTVYIYLIKQYKNMLKYNEVFSAIDNNIFKDTDDEIVRFCDFTSLSSLIPVEEFKYLYTEFETLYTSRYFNFNINLIEKYIKYLNEKMPDNNLEGMLRKKKTI